MPTYATPEMPNVAAPGADWSIPGSPISAKGDMLYWDEKEGKFLPEKTIQQTEPWKMPPYTGLPTANPTSPGFTGTLPAGQKFPVGAPNLSAPPMGTSGAMPGMMPIRSAPWTPWSDNFNNVPPWQSPLSPWENNPWQQNPLMQSGVFPFMPNFGNYMNQF